MLRTGAAIYFRPISRLLDTHPLGFFAAPLFALAIVLIVEEHIIFWARIAGAPETVFTKPSMGAEDEPFAFAGGENNLVKIKLQFRAGDTGGHPNLLQTGVVNSGIRIEIHHSIIAVVFPDIRSPPEAKGIFLSRRFQAGVWHELELTALSGSLLDVRLSGVEPLVLRGTEASFATSDIRIGVGFSSERRFKGEIRNIVVKLAAAKPRESGLRLYRPVFFAFVALFLLAIFAVLIRAYGDARRFLNELHRQRTALVYSARAWHLVRRNLFLLGSLPFIFLILGALHWTIASHARDKAFWVLTNLLPGFESKGASHYKGELIAFALIELGVVVTLACSWFAANARPRWNGLPAFRRLALFGAVLAAAAFAFAPHLLAKTFFGLALAGFLSVHLLEPLLAQSGFTKSLRSQGWKRAGRRAAIRLVVTSLGALLWAADRFVKARLALAHVLSRRNRRLSANAKAAEARNRAVNIAAKLVLLILTLVAFAPWVLAWYRPILPNDYYELADQIRLKTPDGTVDIGRDDFLWCVAKVAAGGNGTTPPASGPACPLTAGLAPGYWDSLLEGAADTASWQGEAGRILFHHAYILVPARHFLSYGLDNAIPYLYGYGNTLFHAGLMLAVGEVSLTTYFATLPFAFLTGLIGIVALVAYANRNVFAAFAALGWGLAALYTVEFTATLLAASFSPLRYLGFVVQIASVFFVFRGAAAVRCYAVPAALVFSFFWNREFAVLGCFAQGLALLSPRLELSVARRLSVLGLSAGLSGLLFFGLPVSSDITSTVQLGFFNIAVPSMSFSEALILLLAAFGVQATLAVSACQFEPKERDARLCALPALALMLIKYIYNPSPPHLSFVLILLLPLALFYYPWTTDRRRWGISRAAEAVGSTAALAACLWAGHNYFLSAERFHQLLTNDLGTTRWTELGERIAIATPGAPIAARVEAIRAELKPHDKLLLLSPFDHLLSFYVNPRRFCGHFDVLTNIALQQDLEAVAECVRRTENILVVYDAAVEAPCPELVRTALGIETNCPKKLLLKKNLSALMARLNRDVMPVGSSGDLSFYRIRVADRAASR